MMRRYDNVGVVAVLVFVIILYCCAHVSDSEAVQYSYFIFHIHIHLPLGNRTIAVPFCAMCRIGMSRYMGYSILDICTRNITVMAQLGIVEMGQS